MPIDTSQAMMVGRYPPGALKKGEAILEAGRREVKEETGYETKDHQLVYSYNASNGSSNLLLHVVFCQLTSKDQSSFDKNEVREVKWFSKDEVIHMIQEKKITDAFTLIGLFLYLGKFT